MKSEKIRKKFTKFFLKKGHQLIPSSSLLPLNDSTVLFTTAGMQQLKEYFLGIKNAEKDFKSNKITSVQKCFRTTDIDSVGDASHATFFEMLGNFSIGGYFKKEAISLAWEFLTKELKIDKNKLWVTFFKGEDELLADLESKKLWKQFVSSDKIIGLPKKDNWWGPPGKTGPCGPCSEIHYNFSEKPCQKNKKCLPGCDCGRFIEIWNLVFMEFEMDVKGKIKNLPNKNIDTGLGLERLALILQNKNNIFETDLYEPLIEEIKNDVNFGLVNDIEDQIRYRIVADHLKGTIFLLSDNVGFNNKEQGYILRRIFRRALDQYKFQKFNLHPILDKIIEIYFESYPDLSKRKDEIYLKISHELDNYVKILNINLKEAVAKIQKISTQHKGINIKSPSSLHLSPGEAFILYSTYGLSPDQLIKKGYTFNLNDFEKEVIKHQEISKKGSEKKFGGHGLNDININYKDKLIMTRYHTATHLLHQALRDILGLSVRQRGSDITTERLRFDFEYNSPLTLKQKIKIEEIVNDKIKSNLPVTKTELNYKNAIKSGALAFFNEKYPEIVSVYSIGNYSKELCGGPHVVNTSELGKFSIISEKSSSAGVRRIKAILV